MGLSLKFRLMRLVMEAMDRYFSTIPTHYNERKTAAAAGYLLNAAQGQRMKYIRLLKLLYMADRAAWAKYGRPITGDEYTSMRQGPVLNKTYGLIKTEGEEEPAGPWHATIERVGEHDVRLRKEPDLGPLSEAEIEILDEIFAEYRSRGTWDVVEELHRILPEWKRPVRDENVIRPENSIFPETILEKVGQADRIEAIRKDLEELEEFQKLLGII